ncbi:uncharacterized protein [Watersipora subatra]|uniref:uncharacterized protein n=1 Tax=Watersipora subatra TaxID=2589382 RepID=UPI00355C8F53
MPVNNGNLTSIHPPVAPSGKAVYHKKSPRNLSINKLLERNSSAPELPPIGIKPQSPSYSSSPTSRGAYGSSIELNIGVDGVIKRTRRSPLSPTSTTSSQEGSVKSHQLTPAGLCRSRTWNGDLNNGQQGGGKLETLYEGTTARTLDSGLAQLSIIKEGKCDSKESKTLTSTITSPPPIASQTTIKNSQTITVISHSQPIEVKNRTGPLPSPPTSKNPQLTVNKLSHENLKKHRNVSQGSSSSSAVKGNSDTGYDTDDEKEHRIVEWLIGVETSHTEQPSDTADLATNEKRDTAIHIVYEGD